MKIKLNKIHKIFIATTLLFGILSICLSVSVQQVKTLGGRDLWYPSNSLLKPVNNSWGINTEDAYYIDGNKVVSSDNSNFFYSDSALPSNGALNTVVGKGAGSNINGAVRNNFYGYLAGQDCTSCSKNQAFGVTALANITTGTENVAVGNQTLSGSNSKTLKGNVAIGYQSGLNATGDYNLFLGYQAGYFETNGDNKLYIENSDTASPLVYGEFDNNLLKINGTLEVTATTTLTTTTAYLENSTGLISQWTNDSGYITTTTGYIETDPVFGAWLAVPPNISTFTNDLGYLTSETDPVWVAASSSYLTTTTASNTYQPIGSYLTTTTGNWQGTWQDYNSTDFLVSSTVYVASEVDPVWTSASSSYVRWDSASTTLWDTAYSWGDWNGNIDISTDTNLGVTATGLELSGDDIALSSGYEIPLSASTTLWESTYLTVDSNSSNWTSAYNIVTASSTFWDEAYSWGNHALAGYLTAETDPIWDSVSTTVAYLANNQTFTGSNIFTQNLTIGDGSAGVDYTLTFDGETNDGVITWQEDEDRFKLDSGLRVEDNLSVGGYISVNSGVAVRRSDSGSWYFGSQGGGSESGTNNYNYAGGIYSLGDVTAGTNNTAINNALSFLTTGSYNFGLGYGSLSGVTTTSYNIGIGGFAGDLSVGEKNTLIGFQSGRSVVNNNTFIGYQAGYSNAGSGNLFLGYMTGYAETGSNKLYIDNSSTVTPLIYGEFDNNYLKVNGGQGVKLTEVTTATYTLLKSDYQVSHQYSLTGTATVTLPAISATNHGQVYHITDEDMNAGTNNITVARTGSDTIMKDTSAVMNTDGMTLTFIANNTTKNWIIQ